MPSIPNPAAARPENSFNTNPKASDVKKALVQFRLIVASKEVILGVISVVSITFKAAAIARRL
jgi:hypothetical protein